LGIIQGKTMANDHVASLARSRDKLVEQRRALVKRDCSTDRAEGYAERIVAIQAAIEATDRAIRDEAELTSEKIQAPVGDDASAAASGLRRVG
jgi:hypothetical protein